MPVWPFILFFIFFVFFLLLNSDSYLIADYSRKRPGEDMLVTVSSFYGFIRILLRIPVFEGSSYRRNFKVITYEDKNGRQNKVIHEETFKLLSNILKKSFIIKSYNLYIRIGNQDAAITAVLFGLLSGIVFGLRSMVSSSIKSDCSLNSIVKSDFGNNCFDIYFFCILQAKTANIIYETIDFTAKKYLYSFLRRIHK